MYCAAVRSIVKRGICVRRRVSDTTQMSDTSRMDFGWYESCHSSAYARGAESHATTRSKCQVMKFAEDRRSDGNQMLTNAGFEVLEAVDGEKGVAMAAEVRPDLILMDIQLPVVDGYEATRRIKANPELRHIPIIAVTSYALSGDDAKALAAGCDGYFAKPFSPRVILAKVREFLG